MRWANARWIAPVILGIFVGVFAIACSDDDDPQDIADTVIAVLSTDTPEAGEPEEEPTEPPAEETGVAGDVSTEGSCEHGDGESVLFIKFSGLEPGQTVSGRISSSPQDGLLEEPEFTGAADGSGMLVVQKRIQRFGGYEWQTDDGVIGSYVVGEACPGPFQVGG